MRMRAGADAPLFDRRHHLPITRPSSALVFKLLIVLRSVKVVKTLLGSGKRRRLNACSKETFLNEEADDGVGL